MRPTTRRRVSLLLAITVTLGLFWQFFGSREAPPLDLNDLPRTPPSPEKLANIVEAYSAEKDFQNIIGISPVVIFSKSYCPHSKKAKHILLDLYDIKPEPHVVEIDLHEHGPELQAYIGEQTSRRTVPNVLVSKTSRGGGQEMQDLHENGVLISRFEEWGPSNLHVKAKLSPE